MKYHFAGEDDHVFKVRHPDGSEFHIAKHALGPEMHKRIKALEPLKMADGGMVEDELPSEYSQIMSEQPEAMPQASAPINPNGFVAEPVSEMEARNPAQAAEPYQDVTLPETAAPAPQMSGAMPSSGQDAISQAFAQKESAISGMAAAEQQKSKEMAAVYEDQAKQMQEQQQNYAAEHAKIDAEHKQLLDAVMKERVDPNRLFTNMGTGNKILAAISIGLSGIGAGLQGPGAKNMAMEVIQKSIDRDIEAQKAELGKKNTLLSENLRRYGDLERATQMTQLQMNAIVQAKVSQIAARSGSSEAVARAKMGLADLGMQAAQIKQQMAAKQMALQGGRGDPSGLVQYLVPEHHQKAVFDEIQRAQDTRRMGESILKAFDQAAQENTVAKTGAGLLRTPGSVLALHQAMQPTFKDLEGTVRQAAMDNTFKNITPAPGDFDDTIKTKRAALEDYLKSKASAPTAKGFGIDLDKFGTTTTQQPQYKTVGGIRYMRGPNGEAVPVK